MKSNLSLKTLKLTQASDPANPIFNPLSLHSVYALRWQIWSFFLLLSFICHWETKNDQFYFICWKPKADNQLDTGACVEALFLKVI